MLRLSYACSRLQKTSFVEDRGFRVFQKNIIFYVFLRFVILALFLIAIFIIIIIIIVIGLIASITNFHLTIMDSGIILIASEPHFAYCNIFFTHPENQNVGERKAVNLDINHSLTQAAEFVVSRVALGYSNF